MMAVSLLRVCRSGQTDHLDNWGDLGMPMIDVYATPGTFADKHALAQELASAVMRWEQVPDPAHAARAEMAALAPQQTSST